MAKKKHPSNRAERLALKHEYEEKKPSKVRLREFIREKETSDELKQVARSSTDAQDNT